MNAAIPLFVYSLSAASYRCNIFEKNHRPVPQLARSVFPFTPQTPHASSSQSSYARQPPHLSSSWQTQQQPASFPTGEASDAAFASGTVTTRLWPCPLREECPRDNAMVFVESRNTAGCIICMV